MGRKNQNANKELFKRKNEAKKQIKTKGDYDGAYDLSSLRGRGQKSALEGLKMRGTIMKVYTERGFGFIRKNSDDVDIFFHFRNLKPGMKERLVIGEMVQFEEQLWRGKPEAVSIEIIKP